MFDVHHTRFDQRQEAKLHRCRVTAGIRHDARSGDFRAIHFRQAVDCLGHQIRACMRHFVPVLPQRHILDAEICGHIDHAHTCLNQHGRVFHRYAVGCREKDQIAFIECRSGGFNKFKICPAAQVGEHGGYLHARFRTRSNRGELGVGMLHQQPQQFHTGVTGAANDADRDNFLRHGCLCIKHSSINNKATNL